MASRKRRHFPESFKRQAVERVRTSGLPICRVAEELGVHETVLRRWMARFAGGEDQASVRWTDGPRHGTGPARRTVTQAQGPSPADLAAENARLKRELTRAQMERDMPRKKPRSSSGRPAGDLPVR